MQGAAGATAAAVPEKCRAVGSRRTAPGGKLGYLIHCKATLKEILVNCERPFSTNKLVLIVAGKKVKKNHRDDYKVVLLKQGGRHHTPPKRWVSKADVRLLNEDEEKKLMSEEYRKAARGLTESRANA